MEIEVKQAKMKMNSAKDRERPGAAKGMGYGDEGANMGRIKSAMSCCPGIKVTYHGGPTGTGSSY
jgi:hypothetical protein